MSSRIFTADLTLKPQREIHRWLWHTAKHVTQIARSDINPFYLLLPLLWLEECNLLRGWIEGVVRVDINEHAAGLTQDRVVLSQGCQMRCRVELGMVRLR